MVITTFKLKIIDLKKNFKFRIFKQQHKFSF